MTPKITMRRALADKHVLGSLLAGDSWSAWRVILIAAMGEALTNDERTLFAQLTNRDHEPGQRVEEFIGAIGRRGGKSRAMSVLATYIAGCCTHPSLVPGERGILLIIAQDQRNADGILNYIEANFKQSPILRQLIKSRIARTLRLTNGLDIEVRPADFRNLRGPTYIAVIADEVAFWYTDNSSNPDDEILAAVRPGLATTDGPLILISSPYARKGELWRMYDRHFGAKGDPLVLVAQGASRTFNPSLNQSVVDRAMEKDPVSARAEYLAEFRTDLEAFVRIEVVRDCTDKGIYERPPQRNITYAGFIDPSGGSSDSFTLCIGHYEVSTNKVIIDLLREVTPPFSPEFVCQSFSDTLKRYGISTVKSDRYAGIWVIEQIGKFGIIAEQTADPKSTLYENMLPLLNARISLLNHPKANNQICALERSTTRRATEAIDHPSGQHDDLANVIAGIATLCVGENAPINYNSMGFDYGDEPDPGEARIMRFRQYVNSVDPTAGGW